MSEPSILVTQEEAARLLGGIGRTTVWRLLEGGHLDRVPIGGRAMVSRGSIDAYVERQMQTKVTSTRP